jgi:ferredoxin
VWFGRRGAGVKSGSGESFSRATEAKEPFSGESEVSRKTIAQGLPEPENVSDINDAERSCPRKCQFVPDKPFSKNIFENFA